ncbi:hypothetical protein [Cryptosporangium aurantiacum]|uniref:Uncharacterized protein n=1 Tax=Cryptosporangium aurantiacum TaxID=134849 RepID=A0A1M7RF88_9ACTN|nr:hypothetical protein [Cryptosporangium aurantiacum]SHN44957.1 hypothetical protein SAMN05443668_11133 [Cryptosporangium aurantiacum]
MSRLPAGVYLRRPGYRILSALVLAVIIAGIVLLARLFGSATAPDNSPDVAPAVEPSRTVSSTEGDDSVYSSGSPSADGVPSDAVRAGDGFVRAWLQPTDGRSQEQWYEGLSRYALPDLAEQLRDVDPTTNPATAVTGDPSGTVVSETSARIVVPTNAGPATTLCVLTADGWRVATIDLGE